MKNDNERKIFDKTNKNEDLEHNERKKIFDQTDEEEGNIRGRKGNLENQQSL